MQLMIKVRVLYLQNNHNLVFRIPQTRVVEEH